MGKGHVAFACLTLMLLLGACAHNEPIPPARIESTEPASAASSDRDAMKAKLVEKASDFQACYEKGLNANAKLAGKLVYQVTINADGKVLEVKFLEDTLQSKEVTECVKGVLSAIEFAKTQSGTAVIRSMLNFQPPK